MQVKNGKSAKMILRVGDFALLFTPGGGGADFAHYFCSWSGDFGHFKILPRGDVHGWN